METICWGRVGEEEERAMISISNTQSEQLKKMTLLVFLFSILKKPKASLPQKPCRD